MRRRECPLLTNIPRLLLYFLRRGLLRRSPLSEVLPELLQQIEPSLQLIKDLSVEVREIVTPVKTGFHVQDIFSWTEKSTSGEEELLPPSMWRRVFSFLSVEDLKSVVLVSSYWRMAGQDPRLAWRRMTVRSRTVLMFGLEHFLKTPTFSGVQTLDFSSVQLGTEELRLLCEFCIRNDGMSSLNLSDKVWKVTVSKILLILSIQIFVELEPSLLCSALSRISVLRLRF